MAGRGSWSVIEGVLAVWQAQTLDSQFRQGWANPSETDHLAFNDTEARAADDDGGHPTPYCVFRQGQPVTLNRMSGATSATIKETQSIPISFEIFGRSKSEAKTYAALVKEKFDRALLTITPDDHIDTIIKEDFPTRQGDATWSWTVNYDIIIDTIQQGALS